MNNEARRPVRVLILCQYCDEWKDVDICGEEVGSQQEETNDLDFTPYLY